ncbi:hypothetical protein [Flexivirga sp. B27]
MTASNERVRVERRRKAAPDVVAMSQEIDAQTMLGEALLRSLMRTQLRLAAVVLALLAITLGSLPLIFDVVPGIRRLHVLGIPLPWLLLGVLVYPVLLGLGWFYVRYAERIEAGFVRLMSAGPAGADTDTGTTDTTTDR